MSLPDDNILSLIRNLLLDDPVGQQNDLLSSLSSLSFPNDVDPSLDGTRGNQMESDLFLPQLEENLSFLPQSTSTDSSSDTDFGGFMLSSVCRENAFNPTQKGSLGEDHYSVVSGTNVKQILPMNNTSLPQPAPIKASSLTFPSSPSNLAYTNENNYTSTPQFDEFHPNCKNNGQTIDGDPLRQAQAKTNGFDWSQSSEGAFGNSCNLLMVKPLFQQEKFESQVRMIANEIHATIQLHMNGLQERKKRLLQQLEHVKNVYFEIFQKYQLSNNNGFLSQQQITLPNITFTKPDAALYKAVSSLGFLTTPAFAPYCTATGDGLEVVVPGVNTSFTVVTRNCFNEELLIGRENITVELVAIFSEMSGSPLSADTGTSSIGSSDSGADKSCQASNKTIIPHSLLDHNNGKYTITYTLPVLRVPPQKLMATIMINGLLLRETPFQIPVQLQHRQFWRKSLAFGTEGNGLGQLCRPWGVAIVRMPRQLNKDQQKVDESAQYSPNSTTSGNANGSPSTKLYLIAVADRSNNRIQLLKYDTSLPQIAVINVFGSGPGSRPGQFDRPAGITINVSLGHIVVADKDNHRIQVFDLSGRYLFKFGEKGNRVGQFCYPWDINHCPNSHQIIVSDTRNRRVQLFTPYGQYITHFAQPLDSPRGVAFLGDNKIVISDFNKHRLLVFDKYEGKDDPPTAKFIGFGEGNGWGEFLRPQGISVNGNLIFCSDSRNNRICIYNNLTQVFEYLTEDLNLDRPSGIAAMDNILVVVDFGNNRIQICHR